MNSQHTPGPWTIERAGNLWRVNCPGRMSLLRGSLKDAEKARDHENAAVADQRVRDAAPDMLAALRELHLLIDFDHEWHACDCFSEPRDIENACKAARAAIAKAEGQTE